MAALVIFLSNNGYSVIDYLLTSEQKLSHIKELIIDFFNEWSYHAPLYFSLYCNNIYFDNTKNIQSLSLNGMPL